MRYDAKKEAADELQVQEKEAANELPVCGRLSTRRVGTGACQDNREYDRGDGHPGNEHKTSCSWDGGGNPTITGKCECAKTSQRESWTKTALGHEQERREGRRLVQ